MANLSSNLQGVLDNRLRYLPEITGKAINSIDWATRIITIGHKYGLHVDEMEDFQGVVLKSMIGLIPPENFETELLTTLALSPATTEHIIVELNTQIFEPIHNFVMNNGKVDGLKTSGIEIENNREVEYTPEVTANPLEIPASPEAVESSKSEEELEDYF